MKQLVKRASATALSALLIADITSSLTPQTYAETSGYACWAITVNNPTLANICDNTPITTSPILCTTEGTELNLPIYFHASASYQQNTPYPFHNLTTVQQNTALLSTPTTNFTLGNNFANSPIPLTYTISSVSNSTNATISLINQNSIQYTPTIGFLGTDTATYTITDANSISKSGKFIIKKNNGTLVDQTAKAIAANVSKGSSNVNILDDSVNFDSLYINSSYIPTIITPPTNGTLNISNFDTNGNRQFNYTPNPGYTGEDTFTYTLTNGSDTSTVTNGVIQVYDPINRPIAPYLGFTLSGNSLSYVLDILAKNRIGYDELFKSGPEVTNLNFTAPQVSTGSLQIPININTQFHDPFLLGTQIYNKNTIIQVDNTTNNAPIISSFTTSSTAPDKITISATLADTENHQGSVIAQISNDNFDTFDSYPISQNSLNGAYSTTVSTLPTGAYSVRLVAQEINVPGVCTGFPNAQAPLNLRTTSTPLSFDISAATLPNAVSDNYTTTTPEPIVLDPLTGDLGTTISIISINGTQRINNTAQTISVPNGTLFISTSGQITFTPDPEFTGQISFPYSIQNINGITSTANQTIIVNPKAIDDTYSANRNESIVLNPLISDTTGTTIKSINGIDLTPGVAQTITVSNGKIEISENGVITFIANISFSGTISFPYVIQNSTGQFATANQNIVVSSTNQVPTNSSNENLNSSNSNTVLKLDKLFRTGGAR